MTAFEAYRLYVALKLHVTSHSYDFVKYHGKTKAQYSTFKRGGMEYMFKKLAERKECEQFIVANLFGRDPNMWVGDLLKGPEAEACYVDWNKRDQSLTYTFTSELAHLMNKVESFDDLIKTEDGEYPILLRMYNEKEVSLDTVSIIEQLLTCMGYWDKKLNEDFVWPFMKMKIEKYKPFRKFDRKKIKKIILDNC